MKAMQRYEDEDENEDDSNEDESNGDGNAFEDDITSVVDGAEALVGARTGGNQTENPKRQVPPSS